VSQIGQYINISSGGGIIETITGNSGGPVGPDAGHNINIIGSGNINVAGNPGTNTETITLVGTTNHAVQIGNASGSLTSLAVATNGQLVIGSTGADPVVASMTNGNNITWTGGAGTLRSDLTGTTNHALQLGNSSGSLTSLGVASNGQLPIGSTGADPVLAALTAGNNITITNGAGSITIAANGGSQVVNYTGVNHAASPYTVLSTDYYISADVTAGVISILLPNAPATGRTFVVKDKVGLAATSNITVTTVGGAVNIDGATSFVMNTAYEAINLIFNGTSYEIF